MTCPARLRPLRPALGLCALVGALFVSAAPALSAPSIIEATTVSGLSSKVTWKNTGGPLLSLSVRINTATDGSESGTWLSVMQGPTNVGHHTITMDLRSLVPDGRHAVSLVAQDSVTTTVIPAAEPLTIDASAPVVDPPALSTPSASGWLGISLRAFDHQSGLDLAQPSVVEVAPWSPERLALAGPWRVLGHLSTGGEGVGVDASALPNGEYVARVSVVNGVGITGRSRASWFVKLPAETPLPEAPPTRLLVRLSANGSFANSPKIRAVKKNQQLVFSAVLRGPAGEVLSGYRVTVRMTDGRGFELKTDALGVVSFRAPVRHGGVVRIRASRRLSTGLSVVAKDLTVTIVKDPS